MKLLITTGVNENASVAEINRSIKNLQAKVNKLDIGFNIDKSALNEIEKLNKSLSKEALKTQRVIEEALLSDGTKIRREYFDGLKGGFSEVVKGAQDASRSLQHITSETKKYTEQNKKLNTELDKRYRLVKQVNSENAKGQRITTNTYKDDLGNTQVHKLNQFGEVIGRRVTKNLEQESKDREKALRYEQQIKRSLEKEAQRAELQSKRNLEAQNREREKALQYEQRVRNAIEQSRIKEAAKTKEIEHRLELLRREAALNAQNLRRTHGPTVNNAHLNDYIRQVNSLSTSTPQLNQRMSDLNMRFREISGNARNAAGALEQSGASMREMLSNALVKVPLWGVATGLIYGTVRAANTLVDSLIQIDTQMTVMSRVTNGEANIAQVLQDSFEIADRLGNRLEEVNDAFTGFARQGFRDQELNAMAETATLLGNVSELSLEDAMSHLTSAVKTFNMEAEESIHVVNALNEIDNNFAVTTANLAQSIQKAGGSANTFGVDLEKLLGHATSIMEITRESGNIVGNSLKTIYSRITTMEKSIDMLEGVGVATRDMAGQLRPVEDILDDLASKWSTLSAEQQQMLGLQLAGRFQLSRFLTLMQSYDQSLAATSAAINSAGSASRENERYLESLEARLNKLSNSITGFFIALGDAFVNDSIILFAEAMTAVAQSAVGLVNIFGGLPVLLTALTPLFLLLNKNVWGFVSATTASTTASTAQFSALRQLVLAQRTLQASTSTLTSTFSIFSTATSFSTRAIQLKAVAINLLSGAARGAAIAIRSLMASTVIGAGLMAVGFVLEKLIGHFTEASQSAKEFEDSLQKSAESINQQGSNIDELVNRFEELNAKRSEGQLSNEEEQEYYNINSQLLELLPSVSHTIDEKGNSVIRSSEALRTEIELLKEKAQIEKEASRDNLSDNFAELQKELKRNLADIEKLKEKYSITEDLLKSLPTNPSDNQYSNGNALSDLQAEKQARQELHNISEKQNSAEMETLRIREEINSLIANILDNAESLTTADLTWLTQLYNDGKLTTDQLVSLGNNINEVRSAFSNLIDEDISAYSAAQISALASIGSELVENGGKIEAFRDKLVEVFGNQYQADSFIDSYNAQIMESVNGLELYYDANATLAVSQADLQRVIDEGIPLFNAQGQEIADNTELINLLNEGFTEHKSILESVLDAYDEAESEMSLLNNLLEDLASGKSLSATEAMKLIKQVDGLTDAITVENGVIKVNEQAVQQLREVKLNSFQDMIRVAKEEVLNVQQNVQQKLKHFGVEIKGIKTVSDAYQEAAKLREEQRRANEAIRNNTAGEESSAALYRAESVGHTIGALMDIGDQLAELDKLSQIAETSLQTMGTSLEDTAGSADNAADSTSEVNSETKEAIYIVNEYKNKQAELRLEFAKVNRLKTDYAQHSKKYQDALRKEIDLQKEQIQLFKSQIGSLNQQIKSGNFIEYGINNYSVADSPSSPSATAGGRSYSGKYAKEVNAAAAKYNLDPFLIAAVIQAESNFNPKARSGAGAQGLMQLMPATARSLGVKNAYDPAQNIMGGAKYLADQLKAFGNNVQLALAAYNAGPGNVRKYGNSIPPFKETQNYVPKVLNNYQQMAGASYGSAPSSAGGGGKLRGWDGKITSYHGTRNDPFTGKKTTHQGIDLRAKVGTALDSPVAGEVVFAGTGTPGSGYNGYGKVVAVRASDGTVHVFGHLDSVSVKKGQRISIGQQVGTTGNTGRSTAPHLHYEQRINGQLGNTKNPLGTVSAIKNGTITASSGGNVSGSVWQANLDQQKDNAKGEILNLEQEILNAENAIKQLEMEIVKSVIAGHDRKKSSYEDELARIDLEQSTVSPTSKKWIDLQKEREKIIERQKKHEEDAIKYIEQQIRGNKALTEAHIAELEDMLVTRNAEVHRIQQQLNEIAFSVVEATLDSFEKMKEKYKLEFAKLERDMAFTSEYSNDWIKMQVKKEKLMVEQAKHDADAIKYIKEQIKNNKNLNDAQKEVLNSNLIDLQTSYIQQELALLDERQKMADQLTDTYKKMYEEQKKLATKVIDDLIAEIDKEASDEQYEKRLKDELDKRQKLMDEISALSLDDSMAARAKLEELQEELEKQNMAIDDMQLDRERDQRKEALNKEKEQINNKYDELINDERAFNDLRQNMITSTTGAIKKDLEMFNKWLKKNTDALGKSMTNSLIDQINAMNKYIGNKDFKPIKPLSLKKGRTRLPMWGPEGRFLEAHEGESIQSKEDTDNLIKAFNMSKEIMSGGEGLLSVVKNAMSNLKENLVNIKPAISFDPSLASSTRSISLNIDAIHINGNANDKKTADVFLKNVVDKVERKGYSLS